MSSRTRWSSNGGGTIVTSTISSPRAFFPGMGAPLSLSRNFWPDFVPGGMRMIVGPQRVGTLDLGAQGGLGDGDGELDGDVRPLAPEEAVRRDLDLDVEVARRPAVAARRCPCPGCGPGTRSPRRPGSGPRSARSSGRPRLRRRPGRARPGSVPVPPQDGQAVENFMNPRWATPRPDPPQAGQAFAPPAETVPRPRAGRAGDEPGQADAGLDAVDGVLEPQAHRIVEVFAALRPRRPRPGPPPPPKRFSKKSLNEDVP